MRSGHHRLRAFSADERGGPAVEFALIAFPLLLLTFGILEFGFALYQWNAAEKATQLGARLAVASWPVASGLESVDCTKPDFSNLGNQCLASDTFGTITCTSNSTTNRCADPDVSVTATCTGGYDPSSTASRPAGALNGDAIFRNIWQRMCGVHPFITPANVQITYTDIPQLRFAGRGYTSLLTAGGVVPEVEVRLRNMNFNFILAGPMIGLDTLPMPQTRATLIGEDMNSGPQS